RSDPDSGCSDVRFGGRRAHRYHRGERDCRDLPLQRAACLGLPPAHVAQPCAHLGGVPMTDLPPAHDAPIAVLDPPAPPATTHSADWPDVGTGTTWPPGPRPGQVGRFIRGKESDPVWVRPTLLALLAATAVLYLWDLGASGWGNTFYAAAVQAGTKSWKAFFFGSSDSSNFITVDKPPAFLWPMEISARIFGLSSWSLLVPQALEGVATVGLVYLSVRRWFSA